METTTLNTTNYELIRQFTNHLLTLDSNEYTRFYCETCYERLEMATECRPSSPFHEKFGECDHCKRNDDVSNPHLNKFLNENGLCLHNDPYRRQTYPYHTDETALLVWNYLTPHDYARNRLDDIYHKEDALFTWIKYGRKKAKDVLRHSSLTQESKELLLTFYSLRFGADRFTPDPSEENPSETGIISDTGIPLENELIDEPLSILPVQNESAANEFLPSSTFKRFKAFVANKLIGWKGERT